MTGLMLVPVLVLLAVCIAMMAKDFFVESFVETKYQEKYEAEKQKNELLEAKLNNIEVTIDVKTIGF